MAVARLLHLRAGLGFAMGNTRTQTRNFTQTVVLHYDKSLNK
tara:strand:+ start:10231 stop:10356 length:126 start_codon:yes stop_codon:yes gene_type:complete